MEEDKDFVICKLCGEKVKRIYGKHLKFKHNGKTTQEYKKEFPNALLMCLQDKTNISINSGKHMKEDKYREMFSEKWKGEKNCNHKLSGGLNGYWECHIAPDWLLIYRYKHDILVLELFAIGTHSDLF